MAAPDPLAGVLLLCVDLQPSFLKVIPEHEELLKRCSFVIEAAVGLGIRVAFTEQLPRKLGGTAPALLALAPGSDVHTKSSFSVFGDDGITDALRSPDIEHIILCGLETPVCIYQTALGALDANLQVTVLSDAIGARRSADAAICLGSLARAGVHLLPSETVFYALLHDAGHPFFKNFTQLVKKYS
ncbi:isochorismatase family protein [Rariglobus hedericola]|uniref:Isochorismatase family protein n=1 Tax=Rariglobus hedericola TaxID=2597822 RepID=A0A556QMV3_9BACT|nr:isochorismatase family protein [Rariglobus hedericola]TSJ77976.1 isochorismatase family protein [Rariglobus hedericola]